MKYSLTLEFVDIEHIQEYFEEMKEFENYKLRKLLKKEVDGRGQSMGGLHSDAKKYHLLHPELKYKECIKAICKLKKEQKLTIV